MDNNKVRKIDVLNLLNYVVKKWLVVLIIAGVTAVCVGGKAYFDYKVQQKNIDFVNATMKPLVYGSFTLYIDNYDGSENYYNRIEDVSSVIKGYGVLSKLMKEHNIAVPFENMVNCVAAVSVGINNLEVSLEGSLLGWSQEETYEATKTLYKICISELERIYGKDCVVTIEEPHEKAYSLAKATTVEDKKMITKKSVIKTGIIGGLAGILLGVVAVLLYVLGSTLIRTDNEIIACYGYKYLGKAKKDGSNIEEYKRIKKQVEDFKSFAVMSVTEAENRREFVDNIARTVAVNEATVALVRIDIAGDYKDNNLYSYIKGTKKLDDIIEKIDNSISVIRFNEGTTPDIDLFTNQGFIKAMEKIKEKFDYVIIDLPAMNESSAGLYVTSKVDASVVVGCRNVVKEALVDRFKDNLAKNDIKPVGLVIVE